MQYHVDHVFPQAQLDTKTLKAAKNDDGSRRYADAEIDELVTRRDLLPNLELLPGPENIGKSDTAPDIWVAAHYEGTDERAAFFKANALPSALPNTVDNFPAFFDSRRELLIARIKDKLKTQIAAAIPATDARVPADIDAELGEGDLDD